jgi:DNA-binding HxlR family transcriptional regulator
MQQDTDTDTKHNPADCRLVGEILARVGDKWTVLLLVVLGDRRMRFKDLHSGMSGISHRMLTVTLRHLERDGLIIRTVYPTIPPRVEYELSERGRSLKLVLEPVSAWVQLHLPLIEASRQRFDEELTVDDCNDK